MARLWNTANAEESWLRAIKGDRMAILSAFDWATTKEGHDYWAAVRDGDKPYTLDIIEKVKMMYVEWKMVGDTDDSPGSENA